MRKYFPIIKNCNNISPIKFEPQVEDNENFNDMMNIAQISSDDNNIYFYAEIDTANILSLNTTLRNVNKKIITQFNCFKQKDCGNIYLHINSDGGCVHSGLLGSDLIKKNEIPITTVVNGMCASSATLISIVGKHRQIYEHSYMLIHQLSSNMWGNYSQLQDEMYNCGNLLKIMKEIYKRHTKIPSRKLEEILKKDIILNAKQCLNFGLVDEII